MCGLKSTWLKRLIDWTPWNKRRGWQDHKISAGKRWLYLKRQPKKSEIRQVVKMRLKSPQGEFGRDCHSDATFGYYRRPVFGRDGLPGWQYGVTSALERRRPVPASLRDQLDRAERARAAKPTSPPQAPSALPGMWVTHPGNDILVRRPSPIGLLRRSETIWDKQSEQRQGKPASLSQTLASNEEPYRPSNF